MKNKENQIEEGMLDFFGCDPAYYSKEEAQDVERAINIGYRIAEKEIKKQIKDLKNKFGSWLVTEQSRRVTSLQNQEQILKLKAKLQALQELEKKLGL